MIRRSRIAVLALFAFCLPASSGAAADGRPSLCRGGEVTGKSGRKVNRSDPSVN